MPIKAEMTLQGYQQLDLPVPLDGRKMDTVGVLPIDTPSGAETMKIILGTKPTYCF